MLRPAARRTERDLALLQGLPCSLQPNLARGKEAATAGESCFTCNTRSSGMKRERPPHPAFGTVPPLPPPDWCSGCSQPDNCRAYRRCLWRHMEDEPRFYRLTTAGIRDRAIGWGCLGLVLGWIACHCVGFLR
jgi:hypothetical protein